MRPKLTRLDIGGYKTIRNLKDFEPRSLTVLIGPNGAGKSNLISFFRLLSWSLVPPGQLQVFVAQHGGASALLHNGPEVTGQIQASLDVRTSAGRNEYAFRLAYAANDTLIYTGESFRFRRPHDEDRPAPGLGAGHREPQLIAMAEGGNQTAKIILGMLRRIVVHQFHNTSQTARIRNKWSVEDGRWLKEDAGNLAPFLFRLQQHDIEYYRRIVDTVRLVLPFFQDYQLDPEYGSLLLKWRETGSDHVFNASQAADGMLRIMALVALLQQPERDLPDVLILDEPELGLHPYAIQVLGELISAASKSVQIVVATQSVSLIDRFEPEDIVVVDRVGGESRYHRLGSTELAEWLKEYTISELWEKNVIGGRPSR